MDELESHKVAKEIKMPTFRVKNLSVTLGDAVAEKIPQKYCLYPTHHCLYPTNCNQFTIPCLYPTDACRIQTWVTCLTPSCFNGISDPCGRITKFCPPLSDDPCGPAWSTLPPETLLTITDVIKTIGDPGVIDVLRGQLEEALEATNSRGLEINESLQPRTAEDVAMLESELQAALDEVRSMKKKMSK